MSTVPNIPEIILKRMLVNPAIAQLHLQPVFDRFVFDKVNLGERRGDS